MSKFEGALKHFTRSTPLPKRTAFITNSPLITTSNVRFPSLRTNMILLDESQIWRNLRGQIQLFGKINLIGYTSLSR